jgi:hypothetical protein
VIDEVDDALRKLIKRDVLNGSDVEIVFDAPTKDWAARRNAPTIDVYLYDIREDIGRRAVGSVDVRNGDGLISARHGPPRFFKFSYLVTAWTQRPEDEHRLLSAVLRCFARLEALPADVVGGTLAAQGYPVAVRIALPPPQDRSVSDVWSALGGELKPSLDLVTLVAVDARGLQPVAPLVTELPVIGIRGGGGQEERKRRGKPDREKEVAAAFAAAVAAKAEKEAKEAEAAAARAEGLPDETVGTGLGNRPGRIVRVRAIPDR